MHQNDRLMLIMIAFLQLLTIWWSFQLTVQYDRTEKAQAAQSAAGCTYPAVDLHQLR